MAAAAGAERGRESGRACHVPSLTLGASCRTSPRKSTGKWQTGLTGFTRSSLDRAAHYHNRLQRRRHSTPVAAAGPAGTLACRAPAATADRAAWPGPARVCTGGPAGAEPRADQRQPKRCGRRRLPADPAVRPGWARVAGVEAGASGGRGPGSGLLPAQTRTHAASGAPPGSRAAPGSPSGLAAAAAGWERRGGQSSEVAGA